MSKTDKNSNKNTDKKTNKNTNKIRIDGNVYFATVEIEDTDIDHHTKIVFTVSTGGNFQSNNDKKYVMSMTEQTILVENLQEALKTRSMYDGEFSDDDSWLYFTLRGQNPDVQYVLCKN
jgi:hypothetical protein